MTPPTVTVRYGDAWELAGTLEPESVDCIGFELNEEYRPLIEQRLAQGVLL